MKGARIAPYVGDELIAKLENPIVFQGAGVVPNAPTYGYDVTILIDVCKAIIRAESDGKLLERQQNLAQQAHIIVGASAKAGIKGLVYALSAKALVLQQCQRPPRAVRMIRFEPRAASVPQRSEGGAVQQLTRLAKKQYPAAVAGGRVRRSPAESAGALSGDVQDVWHLVALAEVGDHQLAPARGLVGGIIGAVLADDGALVVSAGQGQGPAPALGVQSFASIVVADVDDLGHLSVPSQLFEPRGAGISVMPMAVRYTP